MFLATDHCNKRPH